MVSNILQHDSDEPYPELLTVGQFAKMLQVSARTVWRLESAGEVPKPIRVGGNVRWHRGDVQAWLNSRRQK